MSFNGNKEIELRLWSLFKQINNLPSKKLKSQLPTSFLNFVGLLIGNGKMSYSLMFEKNSLS
jgi:hypothetical protein